MACRTGIPAPYTKRLAGAAIRDGDPRGKAEFYTNEINYKKQRNLQKSFFGKSAWFSRSFSCVSPNFKKSALKRNVKTDKNICFL